MNKRIAGRRALGGILALLLLAGCGTGGFISDPSRVDSLPDPSGHTVEYWHTYSDEETRILERELIPLFERNHPGIRIKSVRQTNNTELKNTLFARSASNRGPDVVRMDIAWIPEFVQLNLLVPLETNSGFSELRNELRPDVMSLGEKGGHVYSLPLNVNTKIAIYNRKLLTEAGYSTPPASMREVLKAAEKTGGRIGIGGLDAWRFLPYLYAMGGSFLNAANTRATGSLNSPESVRAVEELVAYYRKGVLDAVLLQGGGNLWEEVRGGDVFMTDEGPWFYSVLDEAEQAKAMEDTVRASMPSASPDRPASIVGGESLVVLKSSRVQADAWTFMEWLAGRDAQLTMAKTGLIPTHLDAVQRLSYGEASYSASYLQALQHSFIRPPVRNWSKLDTAFRLGLKRIFEGSVPVRQGLDELAAELDALLE
ncbi:extracellular solute-binding protein [Gorillibacterium sp. sgz500922]|uniref:extracellular solute-binding protein n=1 Tax=Gorillibacterium sp. sgz500922 TaxID=3446694 RepID=UPI003F671BC9